MREWETFTLERASRILGLEVVPGKSSGERLPANFRVDSRLITPGDGFIAVRGAREDGHCYIKNAVKSGAACVLLETGYFEEHREELTRLGASFIPVENPVMGAARLARAWLDEVSPKAIGITGSVGKTTTRELLRHSLKENFITHSAIKSYNTLIGTSLTILSMPPDTEILILEMGTSHPGEIREMVQNFPISHAIITEVSDAHLEGLGSIEGVLVAKMEIIESDVLKYLSYNSDNDLLSAAVARMPEGEKVKKNGIRQIGVGYSSTGVRISDVRQVVNNLFEPSLFVTLSMGEKKVVCRAPIFGKQHARNIGFAYSVSSQMGLDDEAFVEAAKTFRLPAGRGVIKQGKNECVLIDETYNASPSSISHAIKNLLEMEIPGDFKRVAILGGMRELGAESDRLHEVVLNRAALLDEVYLIGREWDEVRRKPDVVRGLWESVEEFASGFELCEANKSAILLKGSRYYELERLITRLE
jgi:UDP-N-acetylmuramoyl-tripeptide--D-alanyl-D-alanine ligase